MLPVILLMLLLAVTAAVLGRGTSVLIGRMVGKTVHERHTAAESILATGKVPRGWVEPIRRRPGDAERVRRFVLRRLDDLAKHFQAAPVFEDEETRRFLLGELGRIRGIWSTADMVRLLDLGDQPADGADRPAPDSGCR